MARRERSNPQGDDIIMARRGASSIHVFITPGRRDFFFFFIICTLYRRENRALLLLFFVVGRDRRVYGV